MRKRKQLLNIPTGYPYILFDVQRGKTHKYTVAVSEQQAIDSLNIAKGKAFPISVTETIKKFGHKKTNQIFSQFGTNWMCKEDKVFFSKLKT